MVLLNLQKHKLLLYTAAILALSLLSFMAVVWPVLNQLVFYFLVLACLFVSLKNLFYGYLFLVAELTANSMGYLYSLSFGGFSLSLRIALWAVVMAVSLLHLWPELKKFKLKTFLKERLNLALITLALLVLLGLLTAVIQKNSFANLFFDFNNWLYFLTIIPAFLTVKGSNYRQVLEVALAGMLASALETIWFLYAFTHNLLDENSILYAWVRDTRLGEVTLMSGGYYRIFIQSQVFLLPFLFILLCYYAKEKLSKSVFYQVLTATILCLAPVIIGLSRSFWVGLAAGWLFFVIILFTKKIKFAKIIKTNLLLLLATIISVGVLTAAVKFPYPSRGGDVSAGNLLTDRASAVKNEAGASSRWALLAVLKKEIAASPFLGRGFGATVTYQSSDPRILESTVNGSYTTFAFEWGWLDIWLKLGLIGIFAYLFLCSELIKRLVWSNHWLSWGLASGLVALIAVNMFSPYLNHPLGIGYLIFVFVYVKNCLNSPSLAK